MKRTIFFSVMLAALLAGSLPAQEIVYLDEFKAVFEKADREVTEYYRTEGTEAARGSYPGTSGATADRDSYPGPPGRMEE